MPGALAKLPPAHTFDVSVERDLVAKMPDGAELLADRWYPTNVGAGLPPTVLLRSPYGRRQLGMFGRLFAERGYQVVIQSCRGTFGSGGDWEPFRNEERDGKATHDWVASQPWFDGQPGHLRAELPGPDPVVRGPGPARVPQGHGPDGDGLEGHGLPSSTRAGRLGWSPC